VFFQSIEPILDKLDAVLPSSGDNGGVDIGTDTRALEVGSTSLDRDWKQQSAVPSWVKMGDRCADLPVTQTDDPPSGGHFCRGASKTPPCPAAERSAVKIFVL